jgi:hypothetical protein
MPEIFSKKKPLTDKLLVVVDDLMTVVVSSSTAHQLNGLSYIIDDVKEVLHYDLIYSFFEKRRLIKEVKKR